MARMKLGALADIQVGYQARKGIKSDAGGRFKILQGKDVISPQYVAFENIMKFNPDGSPDNYLIKSGDVLFQSRGSNHYAVYIPVIEENVVASGSFYIIRVNVDNVLPSYLAWWLNQGKAQSYFEATAGGTRISFVSIKALSEICVKVPALDVQKTMENTLELWQHELLLYKKMAEKKEQLVKAIFMKAIEE